MLNHVKKNIIVYGEDVTNSGVSDEYIEITTTDDIPTFRNNCVYVSIKNSKSGTIKVNITDILEAIESVRATAMRPTYYRRSEE